MRVHSNTTREDFIELLYRACQDANMPMHVLDSIDDLRETLDHDAVLAKEVDAKEEAESAAKDLYEERKCLREGLGRAPRWLGP